MINDSGQSYEPQPAAIATERRTVMDSWRSRAIVGPVPTCDLDPVE